MPRRLALTLSSIVATAVLVGCGVTTSAVRSVSTTAPPPVTVVTTVVAPTISTQPVTAPPVTTLDTTPDPPAPPQRPPHLRPGVPVVSATRYLSDTRLAFRALRLFSSTLQSINAPGEFSSRLTLLRVELRIFDAAIRRLRGYQLSSKVLDTQRARLGLQGPPLARSMSDFLDAIRDGDRSRASSLAADVQRRLTTLRRAANRK